MRIWFFEEEVAREAASIWKRHGFSATRRGTTVTTDCPTLWAVSVIDREIGFDKVVRMEVASSAQAPASSDVAGLRDPSPSDGASDLTVRRAPD